MPDPDVRAFVFAHHPQHGFLLLQADKKRKGGLHFQVPGGHVDDVEVKTHGLERACTVAAARELFEETGIDIRNALDRLIPARDRNGRHLIVKDRYFYALQLSDADSIQNGLPPLSGEPFPLRLSHEHTGFTFMKDQLKAADAVESHSGGKVTKALKEFVH
eukprot:TRINITY_DN3675_c0_g1_i4.p2 TRINITY_DN3675_c0_g1~~TRINITY_DN3675_c0_g1_i4.p2  ORF type:complete len:168 (+),score=28.94 TRINITY_DN3675_c0_g1_i4:24-506(+)